MFGLERYSVRTTVIEMERVFVTQFVTGLTNFLPSIGLV